jgi:endonuclease YncB( thermonuclease family)
MMEKDIKVEKVKKNFYLTLLVFITVLALTYFYTRTEKVVRVLEGNQLILDSGKKICLIGVDPHNQAGSYIGILVEGKSVKLHYDQMRTDSNACLPAYVYLSDGTFVNAEIIKRGYARLDATFPFKYSSDFTRHQLTAQKEKRGIWSD